jgi:alpha-tubulin suppressor-like RCC1 family protein
MATLNFPDNPSTGDEYYDTNAGFNYEWNGTVWITKDLASVNNTREIDDISSGFDGSDTTFTLQINGVNIVPSKVQQLIISVGGVMQNPGDDYTVSGSTLTFTNAPLSGLSFVGTILGAAVSLNTISAGTVSPSSLTTTSNYTVGSIKVSGASTIGNFVLTGLTTITDPDVTNLNSSGIGTVSNVIITADNSGLGATVGASVGVVTYFGDATNMTGVASSIFPLVYGPGIGSTSIALASDIVTTWNYPIQAGSGTITIRTGSDSGTIVDQFVVGSSSSITISGRSLTLNPAANLNEGIEYFVVYPAGGIKSSSGQKENNRLVTSFTTYAPLRLLFRAGSNNSGVLGLNQAAPARVSSPTQVGGTNWYYTNQDGGRSMQPTFWATKSDGTMWVWGDNGSGQLGTNESGTPTGGFKSSPVQLPGTTWSNNFVTGGSTVASLGAKTDGTLWAWGRNGDGQLGQNTVGTNTWPAYPGSVSSPTQVGTETTWSSTAHASLSRQGACYAIKTDGTLWSWGGDQWGTLGHNQGDGPAPAHHLSSPTQIGTDTTWRNLGGAAYSRCATKTDGTLWVWGASYGGQLGLNETFNPGGYVNSRSSPTQIPGTTWDWVNGGEGRCFTARKTDGTLWTWGDNEHGSLGLNNQTEYSSPTQIGTDTTWSSTWQAKSYGVIAIKTDGTLWSWGYSNGANMQDDNVKYSSPVQVGTFTDWTAVGTSRYGTGAIRTVD